MKLLSVAIPCYNSESYMSKCIESLLPGGEDVEILIVNDGSKDRTPQIAAEYEEKYPGIVRAINQVNKGHGGAVNTGIRNATGLYFKVVDSDDWVDQKAYKQILDTLHDLAEGEPTVDLLISNFVYDKVGAARKKVMRYSSCLPEKKVFGWKDIGHMRKGIYLLMHALIYRTEVLRESRLVLPEHTFYVDNLFAYEPLPFVKNMYYLDVNFYRYFIGREDQSVHESVMISRIDQQIRVNKRMADVYSHGSYPEKQLHRYMFSYLDIITTISSIMLIRAGTEEALEKKAELLKYIRDESEEVYRELRYSLLGIVMNLPGKTGRKIASGAYHISQKLYGFN